MRSATPLGIYTKAHGFLTLGQFEALTKKPDAKGKPQQVTVNAYRIQQAKQKQGA